MASKVDKKGNNNNKIDNDEIGKLLIKMTKNKYEFQDFENLSNEDKLNIYQNCDDELKDSMRLAESFAKDGDDRNCCFGDEILKLIGASTFIGGGSQVKPHAPTSFKKVVKGSLIGAMAGMAIGAIACYADKMLYENSKEKCIIKDDTLQNLENEISKLKDLG